MLKNVCMHKNQHFKILIRSGNSGWRATSWKCHCKFPFPFYFYYKSLQSHALNQYKINLWSSLAIMLHHHLYFCIKFVFIYFVFMFWKILTWLVPILLQDIVAPYGNPCMKNMVIFFPMVNWLTGRFVYTTVSLNWFMCHLQTFQKFNIQHKGMY